MLTLQSLNPRKSTLGKTIRIVLTGLILHFSVVSLHAQLSEGDLMFVAYNGDGDDGFATVALVDIPANTTIYFNDNEWNGEVLGATGAFEGTGEGEMTWTTGTSIILAGTVVVFDDIDNASNANYVASVGTLSGTTALGASDEVLYAFVGTDNSTPTTFLSAIAVTDVDDTDPVFTSLTTASFAENGTGTAYTVAAADANELTYSLGTGNEESLFDIAGGLVTFKTTPDFEAPHDGDNNNTYVIEVVANDGANVVSQSVVISVTNVSDVDPVFTSSPIVSISDNEPYAYEIKTFDLDGDLSTVTTSTLPGWLSLVKTTEDYVSLVAGGEEGFNDGTVTDALFKTPYGIVMDSKGNVFIADRGNSRIRKISKGGEVTTLAGDGTSGSADGTGTDARFSLLGGMTIDSQGNIYAADQINNKIRKITPEGVVSTFAGSGGSGQVDGARLEATFRNPLGLGIDPQGNIYVADFLNHRIRKISIDGMVSTIAGSGGRANAFKDLRLTL